MRKFRAGPGRPFPLGGQSSLCSSIVGSVGTTEGQVSVVSRPTSVCSLQD